MHKRDPILHGLIDGWLVKLSGAEFKLAAYLYRNIGRRRKEPLSMSIAELAAATGISWRQTQAALRKLQQLGIILRTGGRGRITCVHLPSRGDASQASALVQSAVMLPGNAADPGPESSITEVVNADVLQADAATTSGIALAQHTSPERSDPPAEPFNDARPERDITELVINELRAALPRDVLQELQSPIRQIVGENENCAGDLAHIVVTESLKTIPRYTQRRLVLERRVRRALAEPPRSRI